MAHPIDLRPSSAARRRPGDGPDTWGDGSRVHTCGPRRLERAACQARDIRNLIASTSKPRTSCFYADEPLARARGPVHGPLPRVLQPLDPEVVEWLASSGCTMRVGPRGSHYSSLGTWIEWTHPTARPRPD